VDSQSPPRPGAVDPAALPDAGKATRSPRAGERPLVRHVATPGGTTTLSLAEEEEEAAAYASAAAAARAAAAAAARPSTSSAYDSGGGSTGRLSARPLIRYLPRRDELTALGTDDTVYLLPSKEAQLRLALEPGLAAEYASAPTAGGRVAVVDRTGTKPLNVGGVDRFLAAAATHPDEGPGTYASSVQEEQRRAVFDGSARRAAAALPIAGANVRYGDRGLRVTQPVGGQQRLSLVWRDNEPTAAAADEPTGVGARGRLARLRAADAHAAAAASAALPPSGASYRPRDTAGDVIAAFQQQQQAVGVGGRPSLSASGTHAYDRARLLYPHTTHQPVGGNSAPYIGGSSASGGGSTPQPSSASTGGGAGGSGSGASTPRGGSGAGGHAAAIATHSSRHDLTPRRTFSSHTSTTAHGSLLPYAPTAHLQPVHPHTHIGSGSGGVGGGSRRPSTAHVGGSGSSDPYGASYAYGSAGSSGSSGGGGGGLPPPTPAPTGGASARLRAPQPVGGRGLLAVGLAGLDAPDARVGAARRSDVTATGGGVAGGARGPRRSYGGNASTINLAW
jgi:hypothetical protein